MNLTDKILVWCGGLMSIMCDLSRVQSQVNSVILVRLFQIQLDSDCCMDGQFEPSHWVVGLLEHESIRAVVLIALST